MSLTYGIQKQSIVAGGSRTKPHLWTQTTRISASRGNKLHFSFSWPLCFIHFHVAATSFQYLALPSWAEESLEHWGTNISSTFQLSSLCPSPQQQRSPPSIKPSPRDAIHSFSEAFYHKPLFLALAGHWALIWQHIWWALSPFPKPLLHCRKA